MFLVDAIQVKAAVARELFLRTEEHRVAPECLNEEDRFALAMINDILAMNAEAS